mgnify:CR=1 FL=1
MHGASSAGVYADAVESFEEELDGTDDAVAELVVGEAEAHGGHISRCLGLGRGTRTRG